MLVSLLAMVVLYYLVPAALTNMALEGSFGAAFDVGTLKRVLLSADYLVAWPIPFVVVLVMNVVSVLLVALTFGIGGLLLPFVQFYVQVSVFFMFGPRSTARSASRRPGRGPRRPNTGCDPSHRPLESNAPRADGVS